MNDVGQVITDFYSNITNRTATIDDCSTDFSLAAPFNAHEMYDVDEHAFTSWNQFNTPHKYHNDNFTSLSRYNLADKYSLQCSAKVSNYGNLTGITPQVFQPQDILLVQNGVCGSTCTVFSEFMKTQANVSQIVFGGRKQFGPMQGVGEVKGAQVYTYENLQEIIAEAFETDATSAQKKHLMNTYDYETLINTTTKAINRASGTGAEKIAHVNIRNNIRLGDESVTPLQFIYEAADCRLFYTAPMISNTSLVWEAAYAAHWGGGKCVEGSTGHPTSKGGNVRPNTPPANARPNVSVFPSDLKGYEVDRRAGRPTGGAAGLEIRGLAAVVGSVVAVFAGLIL